MALLLNKLRPLFYVHFDGFVAFILDIEVLDDLVCFVSKEEHTLEVISRSIEVVDKIGLHTYLDDLVLEENALRFQTVRLEPLFLILRV